MRLAGNCRQLFFGNAMKLLVLVCLLCVVSCRRESVREQSPKADIASLKTALEAFQTDYGRLPSDSEGWNALISRPADIPAEQWHGPYLDKIPKDPWKHDYIYHYPGRHNTNGFDLYSLGPDGVSHSGGEDADDVNNWQH
jgi:general secretion pathway protein G